MAQAQQGPAIPGSEGGFARHGGGKLAAFLTPEQRAAWDRGDKSKFYPYGRTQAQVIADQT